MAVAFAPATTPKSDIALTDHNVPRACQSLIKLCDETLIIFKFLTTHEIDALAFDPTTHAGSSGFRIVVSDSEASLQENASGPLHL